MNEKILLGKWTETQIDLLLQEASAITVPGNRIDFLSASFLKTNYANSTLIGEINTPEVFIVNFEGVDCLTFIEYIEAMRRSDSFSAFKENLKRVRYRSGMVAFKNRNHFFTDWKSFNSDFVIDVTTQAGGAQSKDVSKRLNEKQDGSFIIPGIPCRLREVTYIPSIHIESTVIDKLQTGDYIGIYSEKDGLDVSHVGILIRDEGAINIRHASSMKKTMEVVDEDLRDYIKSKPGIIVLRPRE